jgi:hypothetical protein
MPYRLLLLLVALSLAKISFAQYFEGEINYTSYYLDKQTMAQMVPPHAEVVSVKGAKYKIFLPNAQQGAMEWEIDNYKDGMSYSRKSYKNINYKVTDKPPVMKDGKLVFEKPDSPMVAPIMRGILCNPKNDTADLFTKYDTTFIINGLKCNVIIATRNNIKTAEYYYCDSIKIDPIQYKCNRMDGLDKLYKFTKGALIVQLVSFGDMYTYVYQMQSIQSKKIVDSVFDIPKGIKIEDWKYQ